MNEQVEIEATALDAAKLVLASAVLIGGVVGYYYLDTQPLVVRWLLVLLALAVSIVIAMQSHYGRELWQFVQTSRVELRKVVWPNRDDTLKMTGVVLLFVVIFGVFFWLLDMLLAWATKYLTGQGV